MKHSAPCGLFTILMLSVFVLPVLADDVNTGNGSPEKFWKAAKAGDVETIQQALDVGVDVDAKTNYGATALAFAAERGHLNVVKILIEAGADVNNQDTFYGATPATWASFNGHTEVAEFLKEHGGEAKWGRDAADQPDKPDPEGNPSKNEGECPSFQYPEITEQKIEQDDASVSLANWPQFRGTAARGLADGQGPPIEWDATTGKNTLWRTPIPGLGHSCPVIWGDKVFLTTAISAGDNDIRIGAYGDVDSVDDHNEHRYVVYCLHRDTGEILWERLAFRGVPLIKRHLKSSHANCTVATDGTHVAALFGSEGMYCYDYSGTLLWKADLGRLDSGWFYDADYQWEFGSSPIIFEDQVIVQCDVQANPFIAAYALSDGSQLWRMARDEICGWSSPAVYRTPAGPMLITNGTRGIRGYDARTGEEWWRLIGNSEVVVPTPFVAYDTIFIASGYSPIQPIYAVSLTARGDISLKASESQNQFVRWSVRKGGSYMPTPLVYRGLLYSCKNAGILWCFDVRTGEQLFKKRIKTPGAASFVASPVAADGHLYCTAEDGYVLVSKAGREYESVAQNPVGESVLATPAISQGTFFVRGKNHVFAFRDGAYLEPLPPADTESEAEAGAIDAPPQ